MNTLHTLVIAVSVANCLLSVVLIGPEFDLVGLLAASGWGLAAFFQLLFFRREGNQ